MKKLVLLATVLAMCAPVFGNGIDPNTLAVLVYKVTANISAADFNDVSEKHAEFVTGKVGGYVLARFDRDGLGTHLIDNNDRTIFILLNSKAKEYILVSDANDFDEVGFNFDYEDVGVFNKINKNGKDTGQDYVFAYLKVKVYDQEAHDDIFLLTARGGMAQLIPSVIEGTTKLPVPKTIKFNNADAYMDTGYSIGYKNVVSATLDLKYTKLATGGDLSVTAAADLIIADLTAKGWVAGNAADYFNWGQGPG